MNHINYTFFEEFKKLEKLCNDIYKSHNGVTNYIDDMNAVSFRNYYNIPNWEADLHRLKQLRHIRNTLAHVEGAFNENICTQQDIEWVQAFYERILKQSDPLAIQYRNSQSRAQTTLPQSNKPTNQINPETNITPQNTIPKDVPKQQVELSETSIQTIIIIIAAILFTLIVLGVIGLIGLII